MLSREICNLRLRNQKIENSDTKSVFELVSTMGAMQAQDFKMANWAIGLRVSGTTISAIKNAYNNGEILRTHLLRPTWHFVSSEDIYWMLKLTAPQILKQTKTRDKQLELTNIKLNISKNIIEKMLLNSNNLTRQTIEIELNNAGIITNENRLSHILIHAELEGLICSGPILENEKLSYSLLENRISRKDIFTKEESLYKLAKTYFKSHGPATLKDFSWWSGLTLTDSKKAIESIQSNLETFKSESDTYYYSETQFQIENQTTVHLLPAYDEYLISYSNRNAALEELNAKNTISSNGIFYPIIVVNGKVVGIWKRKNVKGEFKTELTLFTELDYETKKLIDIKIEEYKLFLD